MTIGAIKDPYRDGIVTQRLAFVVKTWCWQSDSGDVGRNMEGQNGWFQIPTFSQLF